MKKMNFFKLMTATMLFSLFISACSEDNPTDTDEDKSVKIVQGTLSGDIVWSKDTIYKLRGFVRIGEDLTAGGTPTKTGKLTIEAGTVILGERATKGTLIIQRGSQIFAEGTPTEPIVFTSERAPGLRAPGDWSGLVICGKATNNLPGGVGELEGGYGAYHGGSDNNDNSGILRYVRIEFAGIAINPNQEVNSLTMGSVGSETVIENIQASFGGDDAFEWFGGTVNCKNLIAYRCQDDDMDVDNGYSGNVQFAVCIKDPFIADQSGSNGFEVDNDGAGSTATPFTSGTFSNITIVGPKGNRETNVDQQYQNALHLRRNCKVKIHNSLFVGFPNGVFIDGSTTQANATADELVMKNCVLSGVENWGGNAFGSAGTLYVNSTVGTDTLTNQHPQTPRGFPYLPRTGGFITSDWFSTGAYGNSFAAKYQDLGISESLFDFSGITLLPTAGSSLLTGASFTGLPAFFTSVTHKGAFGTTDWTSGWAEWNPIGKTYQ
jgi:hypothetical protein